MKFRILKANQIYNTWAKYGVLTSDNKFYCPYFDFGNPAKFSKDVDNYTSLYPLEKETTKPISFSNYQFFSEEIILVDVRINEKKMILEYLKTIGLSESNWDDSFYKIKSEDLPKKYFNLEEGLSNLEPFSLEEIIKIGKTSISKVLENYKTTNEKDELLNEIGKKFPNLGIQKDNQWEFPLWAYAQYFIDFIGDEQLNLNEDFKEKIKQHSEDVQVSITDIQLKNIGRFSYLGPLEIGNINYLVGPNNAGKSTFINAIKILDLLFDKDSFGKLEIPFNVNKSIKTYGLSDDDTIELNIKLTDKSIEKQNWEVNYELSEINTELEIKKLIFKNDDCELIIENLENDIKCGFKFYIEKSEVVDDEEFIYLDESFPVESVIIQKKEYGSIISKVINELFNRIKDHEEEKKEVLIIKICLKSLKQLSQNLGKINNHNLSSSVMKLDKKLVFDYENPKLSLHEKLIILYNKGLRNGRHEDKINSFFYKWLCKIEGFSICDNFDLVLESSNEIKLTLIDKGTPKPIFELGLGSQRIIELLVNIAHFIFKELGIDENKPSENDRLRPFIFIEEPEAHLHPNWQSKLAVLFYELNEEYHLRFIIETHSEYIIRKTQLITFVSKKNPFCVLYFDRKKLPYSMGLSSEGRFKEEFGIGFSDEIPNIVFEHFELLKNN